METKPRIKDQTHDFAVWSSRQERDAQKENPGDLKSVTLGYFVEYLPAHVCEGITHGQRKSHYKGL